MHRNGDIVEMTSYAPLLAKEGFTQWNPDLIYFNNSEVKLTAGYQEQKLFGYHSGNKYNPSLIRASDNREDINKRIASSFVTDAQSDDLSIKLVNLLPVDVSTAIDLSGMNVTKGEKAILTVMIGDPDDKSVIPVESTITTAVELPYELPAYSFSVIRIKRNSN